MPARTPFYHYQVGHCSEPARTLFVAGSELVRVRVDPEPTPREGCAHVDLVGTIVLRKKDDLYLFLLHSSLEV